MARASRAFVHVVRRDSAQLNQFLEAITVFDPDGGRVCVCVCAVVTIWVTEGTGVVGQDSSLLNTTDGGNVEKV